jgi:hypothetical protein
MRILSRGTNELQVVPLITLIALYSWPLYGQDKLRDRFNELPADEKVSITITSSFPTRDLPSNPNLADLVVEGIVERATSAMTKDERSVQTIYDVVVDQVLFSNQLGTVVPGPGISRVRVTQTGGQIDVGDRTIVVHNNSLPTLSIGSPWILFLGKPKGSTNESYEIVGGPYGTFEVKDGQVNPYAQHDPEIKTKYDGGDVTTFRAYVIQAAAVRSVR